MKTIKSFLAFFLLLFIGGGCTDFEELNKDPNLLESVNPATLLNPIIYNVADFNWNRANKYTFDLMQVTVPTNSLKGISNYDLSNAEGDATWVRYYLQLASIEDMYTSAVAFNDDNYQAIALTLRAWVRHLLVDCFGDVPMSEALQGGNKVFSPKFDTQQEVYAAIVADLVKANSLYNTKAGLRFNQIEPEILYLTDDKLNTSNRSDGIIKWQKFNNSLLLRALNRVKDASLTLPVTIEDILLDNTTYPVIETSGEEALLSISGVYPLEAPMARPDDFTNYRTCSEFIIGPDAMGAWYDNRRGVFYKTTSTPTGNKYVGYPSGYDIVPPYTPSKLNADRAKAPLKIAIMTLAEVQFIKAEYYWEKGQFSNMATAYENGIKASHDQWGVAISTSAGGMLNNVKVKLVDGDNANNFKKIMLQKYLALIFCDYQQWFEYLRTGEPNLPKGDGGIYQFPQRFIYPASVQRTNMSNYQEVVDRIGKDAFTTKLFWHK